MAPITKVLYIQHATAMGGSVLSLLYLIQKLDRKRFLPIVACVDASGKVPEYYMHHGIDAFHWPGLAIFPHTTGGWYPLYNPLAVLKLFRHLLAVPQAIKATRCLIREINPDLVHLNSVVLVPSAIGASKEKTPLVWHVREVVVRGHVGVRQWAIRRLVGQLSAETIFISSDEQGKSSRSHPGVYIPNFVDFRRFDKHLDKAACRREFGLKLGGQVVLFLGGLSEIKGALPFLEALRIEHLRNPRVTGLMGAGLSAQSSSIVARIGRIVLPLIGRPTSRQKVNAYIERYNMKDYVQLLPFRSDVERMLSACDVLVFPSIEPHFGRPIIEAGAMCKPVVASRIGGAEELIDDGITGILVPPGDAVALADAFHRILVDHELANRMGQNGFDRAQELYNASTNAAKTVEVYERILQCLQATPPMNSKRVRENRPVC